MMFLASNISFAVDCPNSSPQLLYRCIETVNASHNTAHAQMDVKLRSLVCMGLNEQVYIFNFAFFFGKVPEFFFLAQAFANLHGKCRQGKLI